MYLYTLLIVSITIVCLIYGYFIRNNNYWINRNVPHRKPKFFYGSFIDVFKGKIHFGELYADLYNEFKDASYFGIFKMASPALVVKDPELIKSVLVRDFTSFMDNEMKINPEVDPIWIANLSLQTGDMWKKNRIIWGSGFTPSKIKGIIDIMENKSDEMINYLNINNQDIEAREIVTKYFNDVVVTSVFGLDCHSFENNNNSFRNITKNMMEGTFWEEMVQLLYLVAPGFCEFIKLKFLSKRVEKDLIGISKSILKNRREMGYDKNNIFDSMIMNVGDVNSINEIDVSGYLLNFLLDGTETAAVVGAYMLYAIAANQDIQTKLYKEINTALDKNNGKWTYDDIQTLSYLDMTVSETMRRYPVTLAVQRLCTKSCEISTKNPNEKPIRIPVGMSVAVPTYAIHMDPKYYPDPEVFNPERFTKENIDKRPKYTYLPFGEGPRLCIGYRLGVNQVKMCIIAILIKFKVELSQRTVDKPPIIDPKVFILKPIDGIWLKFNKR